jgi:hypothetical protein
MMALLSASAAVSMPLAAYCDPAGQPTQTCGQTLLADAADRADEHRAVDCRQSADPDKALDAQTTRCEV